MLKWNFVVMQMSQFVTNLDKYLSYSVTLLSQYVKLFKTAHDLTIEYIILIKVYLQLIIIFIRSFSIISLDKFPLNSYNFKSIVYTIYKLLREYFL